MASALTASVASMIARRSCRSAATPASRPNSANGTIRANVTRPACAADPSPASTSSG